MKKYVKGTYNVIEMSWDEVREVTGKTPFEVVHDADILQALSARGCTRDELSGVIIRTPYGIKLESRLKWAASGDTIDVNLTPEYLDKLNDILTELGPLSTVVGGQFAQEVAESVDLVEQARKVLSNDAVQSITIHVDRDKVNWLGGLLDD